MGCWASKINEEYEGKKVGSIASGEPDIYTTRRERCDRRDSVHREKEICHSRNRDSESDERKPLAEDGKPQMKEMTEQDYVRYRDAEEIRMGHDLAKDISELEGEYMEKEMRDVEDEHGYEGRYRIDIDYKTSLDSRTYRRDDDRSNYTGDVSAMSSVLSVLHESPDEG